MNINPNMNIEAMERRDIISRGEDIDKQERMGHNMGINNMQHIRQREIKADKHIGELPLYIKRRSTSRGDNRDNRGDNTTTGKTLTQTQRQILREVRRQIQRQIVKEVIEEK